MQAFTVWVDADSCPIGVRDMIIRFAQRLKIPTVFTANRPIPLNTRCSFIRMTVSETTPDAADNYIVEHCSPADIAVTRDIPLASRLIDKGIRVLNDRGTVYTRENIGERLSLRNFNLELYENGLAGEKTSSFGKKELNLFANSFDKELQKKIKELRFQATQPLSNE
ncbi:DUF188 domain-containing protein [Treponema sp. OMZ 840]|uniref:YaiI/YqxD family protein n=1 Tax=Treponema sp. OMZ 840 TaxID=244313 RepID=UPI003D8DEBCD